MWVFFVCHCENRVLLCIETCYFVYGVGTEGCVQFLLLECSTPIVLAYQIVLFIFYAFSYCASIFINEVLRFINVEHGPEVVTHHCQELKLSEAKLDKKITMLLNAAGSFACTDVGS